jgi:NAD(P)-dependent dehydrogenase (short-subunit alcohol dehydrogenase family)
MSIRTAIVTGGGHGIGRAICRRLRRDGATVVVVDIDSEAAENVAAEINGIARVVDVGDEAAMRSLMHSAMATVVLSPRKAD